MMMPGPLHNGFNYFLKKDGPYSEIPNKQAYSLRDHPLKTSACLRGGGVKNLPNLPTDSTKKLPTVGG